MNENRRDPRLEEYADVSVRIQSAPEARDLEGKIFPSYSEDVSLSGMRLDVDIPVPIGALLELEITLHNSPTTYRHLGNVVWSDVIDDDNSKYGCEHEMGVMLQIASNPQFDSWTTAVSNL
jgi:PilZ domain